jgi:tRNA threonylcarbamoyladenosine biosynthesis protein TsaE
MSEPQDITTGPPIVERTVRSSSAAETRRLAARLGAHMLSGLVIALHGDLGSGKTTFIQGLAVGLDVVARVTSPTFVLVNEYRSPRRLTLIHIDAYRLPDAPAAAVLEADTFGIEEILAREDAVVAVEWAERLRGLLPADVLHVELARTDEVLLVTADSDNEIDARIIRLTATGERSTALLEQLPL